MLLDKSCFFKKIVSKKGGKLKIIVEKNCVNRKEMVCIANKLDIWIRNIVESLKLDSLRFFVIADNDEENYNNSVKKYANKLAVREYVENDINYNVVGKTIEGYISEQEYAQVIVIKSALVVGMYNDLLRKNDISQEPIQNLEIIRNIGLLTVMHEIGHAIDNSNLYRIRGDFSNKKIYDLKTEFNEYVESIAYILWGEYFAESFSYKMLSEMGLYANCNEKQMKDCIASYSREKSSVIIVERVHRILYLFMHYIACLHNQEQVHFDCKKYAKDEIISDYVPFLKKTEDAIVKMKKNYPWCNAENCMNDFIKVITDMIKFEKER